MNVQMEAKPEKLLTYLYLFTWQERENVSTEQNYFTLFRYLCSAAEVAQRQQQARIV